MSTFLSSTSNTHAHTYQSRHLNVAPASSFSRPGAVRDSLRRIPSSIFARGDDKSVKGKASKLNIFEDGKAKRESSGISHPRSLFSSPKRVANGAEKDGDKVKLKGKTRKALAEILHWGNSNSTSQQEQPKVKTLQIPAPIPEQSPPALPPKPTVQAPPILLAAPTMPAHAPAVLRKRSSRHLSSQPSRSALSNFAASLRGKPSVQDVKSRARPSMAPDPFERPSDGADVVERIPSRIDSISSTGTSLDRRGSIASRKALSVKTVKSVAESAKTLPER